MQAYKEAPLLTLRGLNEQFHRLAEELDSYALTYQDVFPGAWQVAQTFTHECCTYVRGQVDGLVISTEPSDEELGDVLQATREFEDALTDRFLAMGMNTAEEEAGGTARSCLIHLALFHDGLCPAPALW